MEKQLKAALLWDPFLDNSTIDAAVIHRVAYLSGAVDSSFQKAEAQDVASRIKGVVEVRNRLKVEPEYYSMSDSDYDYITTITIPTTTMVITMTMVIMVITAGLITTSRLTTFPGCLDRNPI
jgi:hypothetical protein